MNSNSCDESDNTSSSSNSRKEAWDDFRILEENDGIPSSTTFPTNKILAMESSQSTTTILLPNVEQQQHHLGYSMTTTDVNSCQHQQEQYQQNIQQKYGTNDYMKSILTKYIQWLDKYPIYTKSILSGSIGIIGSFIGQWYYNNQSIFQNKMNNNSNIRKKLSFPIISKRKKTDWYEVVAFALYGTLIGGPFGHYW